MKKVLLIVAGIITLLAIPVTFFVLSQRQDIRSKAAPATTLVLRPATATKKVGETVTLDVVINTGENAVLVADLYITYDQTKLEGVSIVNGSIFPSIFRPGVVEPGKMSIMVGALDSTSLFTGEGTVITIKLKALAPSSSPVVVQFTEPTYVAASREAANVLIGSTPARITITDSGGGTLPTATPTPLSNITPTRTPTPRPGSATVTPTPTGTANARATITYPTANQMLYTTTPTMRGTAPPNSTVTFTIYPETITDVASASATGSWTYTPQVDLESGPHDLTISAQDPAGETTYTASVSFVIAGEDQTASESATPVAGTVEITYSIGIIGFILILAGIAIAPATSTRRRI